MIEIYKKVYKIIQNNLYNREYTKTFIDFLLSLYLLQPATFGARMSFTNQVRLLFPVLLVTRETDGKLSEPEWKFQLTI